MKRKELRALSLRLADRALSTNEAFMLADFLHMIVEAQPVAWRWLYDGTPEPYALGGSLCFDGTGPDDDIAARAAARPVRKPRTVQKFYTLPIED